MENEKLKWSFEYLGEVKESKTIPVGKYFCIMTNDGTNRGKGLSHCYCYYVQQPDRSLKTVSYMSVPRFSKSPSKFEANMLMDEVTRFFHGWIPYVIPIVNKGEGEE